MGPSHESGSLAEDFVLLNDVLHAGGARETALRRLVDLAVTSIPGCDWAAITTWPATRRPKSLAYSGEVARAVDQLQYDLYEGPCLTAAIESEMMQIADVANDEQWPAFSAAVLAGTPVRAVMSFHLADLPYRSALNLYSGRAGAFDEEAITIGALFTAHARVLLFHAASADKAANLENALMTSRQIGAAIGILMNVHKITGDQAFELLRTTSQQLNRKLHDIAYDVTQTGELPERRHR